MTLEHVLSPFALVLALLPAACSDESRAPQSEPFSCEDGGPGCGSGAGAGVITGPPKDAAVQDTATDVPVAPTVNLTGSIIQFLDSDFSDTQASVYKGPATVGVPGNTDDFFVGGDAGVTFTAKTLVGEGWFSVVPSGNPDLMTTHDFLTVASEQSSIDIPVIDRTVLSAAYLQASAGAPLDTSAGQLIVRFYTSQGAPASGVRITFSPFTGATAFLMYDTGPGGGYEVDTNGLGKTSTNGTVIIGNVTDGIGSLTYEYDNQARQTPTIMWVKPQATFARIFIPSGA